ncbi:hypothetical protein N7465_011706 [Penicillium sp. CMV-2018d]|nr:hypothetical protein N7465_011706 [Penicillium sp. CMV-2018d]
MSTLMQAISFGDKDAVFMSLSAVIVADRRHPGRAIYGAIWSLVLGERNASRFPHSSCARRY